MYEVYFIEKVKKCYQLPRMTFIPTIFVVLNYNEAIIFQKNLTNSTEITMTPVENDPYKK